MKRPFECSCFSSPSPKCTTFSRTKEFHSINSVNSSRTAGEKMPLTASPLVVCRVVLLRRMISLAYVVSLTRHRPIYKTLMEQARWDAVFPDSLASRSTLPCQIGSLFSSFTTWNYQKRFIVNGSRGDFSIDQWLCCSIFGATAHV